MPMEYNSLTLLFHSFTLFLHLCSLPYEWSGLFPYKFFPVSCRCSHFSFQAPSLECELNSCLSLSLKVRVLKQLLIEVYTSWVMAIDSVMPCVSSQCRLTEAYIDSHRAARKSPGPSKERKLLLGRKNSCKCRQKRQLAVCSAKLSAHEHLEGTTYTCCVRWSPPSEATHSMRHSLEMEALPWARNFITRRLTSIPYWKDILAQSPDSLPSLSLGWTRAPEKPFPDACIPPHRLPVHQSGVWPALWDLKTLSWIAEVQSGSRVPDWLLEKGHFSHLTLLQSHWFLES